MSGFAWVTLATNDAYSLGALVLAHSLRRVNTAHQLVVLVTPGVSASMRNQLRGVFNLIEEVNILDSQDEANLALLSRPELGITFTKLHCWRLTQYEKCVFLDADTMVLKNADELFEREELSAAPDPGWPDCFNSGVFVYRPSMDTFKALVEFAVAKGSFDGADQGLLNIFFADWATKDLSRHLPFIYNLVSSAMYSYLPAYKQFGENAKIVHFIGAQKPWLQYFDSETRLVHPAPGNEHLRGYLQLWWDIFCSTVHPSLSPEMAHRRSHETRVDSAMTTVSHFITDFFQKLEPMSIYTDFPPVSTTPYTEDPSLGFWDPWETYVETPRKKLYDSVVPFDYHGSKQQREAFKGDERQTGWQRHHNQSSNSSESQSQILQIEMHPTYYSLNEQHCQEVYHEPQILESRAQPTSHGQYSDSLQQSQYQPTSHDQHIHNSQPKPFHNEESGHKHIHALPSHNSHYHHSYRKESYHKSVPSYDASCQKQHQCDNSNQVSQQSSKQISHEYYHYQQEHDPVCQDQPPNIQVSNSHIHHTHQDQEHNLYKSNDIHEYQTHQLQNYDQSPPGHQNNSHNDTLRYDHSRHPDKAYQGNHKPQTHIYDVPPHPWERQKESDDFHTITPSQNHSDSNCKCVNVAIVSKSLNLASREDKPSAAAEFEAGLAGALAQLTLGVPRSAEQTALEEHMRRQAWEQGNADYMGRDSFDNIWRKICQTLSEAPAPDVQPKSSEATKASKPSKSDKPSESSEASKTSKESTAPSEAEKASSTVAKEEMSSEVSAPEEKSVKEDLPKTHSATPPTQIADNSKQSVAQTGKLESRPMAQPEVVTGGGETATPATPSIIAATPPTSPPVLAPSVVQPESISLIVDTPTPETPPVGSEVLKKDISSLSKEIKGITSESQALPQAVIHTVATVPVFPPPEAKVIPSVPSAKVKPQSETKAIPLPLSPETEQATVLPPVEAMVKDMPVPPPPPPPAEAKKAPVTAPTETKTAHAEIKVVSIPFPPAEAKRAPIPLPPAEAKGAPIPLPAVEAKGEPIPLPLAEAKGAQIPLPPAEAKGESVPPPPAETKAAPIPSPPARTKGVSVPSPPADAKDVPIPSPPADAKDVPIPSPPADAKGVPIPSPPADAKGVPIPSPPADAKGVPIPSPPADAKGVPIPSPPADAKGVPVPSPPADAKGVPIPLPADAKSVPIPPSVEAKGAPISSPPETKAPPVGLSAEAKDTPATPSEAKSVPVPPSLEGPSVPKAVSSDSKVPVQPISSDAAESKSVDTSSSASEGSSKSPSEAKAESKTQAEQPATKPKTPKGIPTPPVEEATALQAPVPPKRRAHKGGTSAAPESGSASKPAQASQGKGSKPGQKSKK